MIARGIALALLLAAGLAACGDEPRADQPPEIEYGADACSRCGMIISEERYASGLVDENGDALIFDDIGEMLLLVQEEGLQGRRVWVHDADSLEWLDGVTAYYAVSRDVVTPMGSGVTAFAERAAADAFAGANSGMVMTWEQMLADWEWDMQRQMNQ